MSWKCGIWFQRTSRVPNNRITNLDVGQGLVMRALKISTLAIQTAGCSELAVLEIRIDGMEHAEELRGTCSLVHPPTINGKGTGGAATLVQTVPHATDQKILEVLIRIRLLLEIQ